MLLLLLVGPVKKSRKMNFLADPHLFMRILLVDPVPEAWMVAVGKGHFTTSHIPDGDSSQRISFG
jgi:hypothetical protein